MISGNLLIICISFMTKFGHFQTQVNSFDLDVCVAVASRTIIRTFTEEVWMGSVPIFHGLHRRLAFQC